MQNNYIVSILALSSITFAGTASAQNSDKPLPNTMEGAPVVLSGTVGMVSDDEFQLEYNGGEITVALERFGWNGEEADLLIPGEAVTVTGYLDNELFEGREIDAYTVSLDDNDTYYYTTLDYPNYYMYNLEYDADDGAFASMRGEITDVDANTITVTNENRSMIVDVTNLDYDPFDSSKLQELEIDDEVYVYGNIDDDFLNSESLVADGVVELIDS